MLLDPVTHAAATAPPDDEPVTSRGRRRFHSGQAWFAQRGGVMRIFGVRHRSEAYR